MKIWKRRAITFVTAFALAAVVSGSGTLIADAIGWSVTPQAYACESTTSGGGC